MEQNRICWRLEENAHCRKILHVSKFITSSTSVSCNTCMKGPRFFLKRLHFFKFQRRFEINDQYENGILHTIVSVCDSRCISKNFENKQTPMTSSHKATPTHDVPKASKLLDATARIQ